MPSGAGSTARRYADAVFELARESQDFEGWHDDLELLADVFKDRVIVRFFSDPKRSVQEKHGGAHRMFEGRIKPEALNLLLMLIDRGRVEIIPAVMDRYDERAREAHGIVIAEVTTAIQVDAEERRRIAEELTRMTGKRVQLQTKVDDSIIGGLVVRIGDKLIDGSVRTSLQQLRQRLA